MKTILTTLAILISTSSYADQVLVSCTKPETQVVATLSLDSTSRIHSIQITQAGVAFRNLKSSNIEFFPQTLNTNTWKEVLLARRQKIFDLQVELPLENIPGRITRFGTGKLSAVSDKGKKLSASDMSCLVF